MQFDPHGTLSTETKSVAHGEEAPSGPISLVTEERIMFTGPEVL